MSALASHSVTRSWLGRAWEVVSDHAMATALVWALPLLLGIVAAAVRLLLRAI